jgi:hypothetical protein
MLGNFIQSIKMDKEFVAKENLPGVVSRCPGLRYSCCDSDRLDFLTNQLRTAMNYLNYRYGLVEKLFNTTKVIAKETYKVFLSELNDDDIQCYNKIKKEKFNHKYEMYKNDEKLLAYLNSVKYSYQFNSDQSLYWFLKFKTMDTLFLRRLKGIYSDKEKFYSSFICSICSPAFVREFKQRDDGNFEFEINKFACKHIIKKRHEMMNSLYIYQYIQDMIDLIYCSSKNSKKDILDYNYVNYEAYNLDFIPVERFKGIIAKEKECVNNDKAFVKGVVKDIDCKQMCHNDLGFFRIRAGSIEKIIRTQNLIDTLFSSQKYNKKKNLAKLDKQLDEYNSIREKNHKKGILKFNEDKTLEKLTILKMIPDHIVNLDKMKLDVSDYTGFNISHFPMDQDYYRNGSSKSFILSSITLLLFLAIS